MLSDTKLATVIDPNVLLKIQRLGEKVKYGPNEILVNKGDESEYIYISLEGDIYIGEQPNRIWIGPGDIFGEIGYILGTPRTTAAVAGESGCILWRTHRRYLEDDSLIEIVILITHFLIGLAPYIHLRLLKVTTQYELDPNLPQTHCDHDHPAILRMAQFLKGKNEWESAVNIWEFVRNMPYRFGFWNVRASETLALGFGMCTTKANLQVALLRALGIESRFGECEVAAKYLVPFLPPAYRNMITKDIKHYFGIVYIDGQAYRSDASFTREALQIIAEAHPEYSFIVYGQFDQGKEFAIEGKDEKIDYRIFDDLSHVMLKRPFFDAENADAMNLFLDRYQGSLRPIPQWVESTRNLLSYNPKAARMKALAGLVSDLNMLHQAVEKRERQNAC